MAAQVKDIDRGWKRIKKVAESLKRGDSYVKVGVLGGPKAPRPDGNVTNVDLAIIHEFGAPAVGIPERSFLRSTFDAKKDIYMGLLQQLMEQVYSSKMTVKRALGLVGTKIASDVKGGITEGVGIPPPLKPETIARKGSTRPLVDTGRLLNSITHAVVLEGQGE